MFGTGRRVVFAGVAQTFRKTGRGLSRLEFFATGLCETPQRTVPVFLARRIAAAFRQRAGNPRKITRRNDRATGRDRLAGLRRLRLIDEEIPPQRPNSQSVDLTLDRDERPFRLSSQAADDFEKALTFIPSRWSAAKKKLWGARLELSATTNTSAASNSRFTSDAGTSNGKSATVGCRSSRLCAGVHRRIYVVAERKGRMVYRAQSERRPARSARLVSRAFKDARVAAAWPVTADAIYQVEKFKCDALDEEKKESAANLRLTIPTQPSSDSSATPMLDQSVAHGIPPAKPWNELAEKKNGRPHN